MMSKKFYIGICCLALLATSVASGYSEDFEGYTGNLGDPWSGTPEFNASGWTSLYRGTYNRGDVLWNLGAGYNSAQGITSTPSTTYGHVSAAHLLDAPQGASSTFVYTAMVDGPNEVRVIVGSDSLTYSQDPCETYLVTSFVGSSAILAAFTDGGGYIETPWKPVGLDINALNWVEIRTEVDTDANARATVLRTYVRDLDDGGAGPTTAWNQVDWGGPGGGLVLPTEGPDYPIEAIGIRGKMAGAVFDNLYATPEPVTLAILGAGGLLVLLRRRR